MFKAIQNKVACENRLVNNPRRQLFIISITHALTLPFNILLQKYFLFISNIFHFLKLNCECFSVSL